MNHFPTIIDFSEATSNMAPVKVARKIIFLFHRWGYVIVPRRVYTILFYGYKWPLVTNGVITGINGRK